MSSAGDQAVSKLIARSLMASIGIRKCLTELTAPMSVDCQ